MRKSGAGGMAEVVEGWPSKLEALNSIPSTKNHQNGKISNFSRNSCISLQCLQMKLQQQLSKKVNQKAKLGQNGHFD
jgi:hypothetical protein